ncbi:O-antigen ligase family protein [Patescibacteria group bacterium]
MIDKLLLLLAIYLPFQIALSPAEGIDAASIRLFIPALFLLWILIGLKNKHVVIRFNIQTLLVFSFLFFSAFSLFFTENLGWGLRKLLFLLSIFPLYFIASAQLIKNKTLSEKILKYFVIGATIISSIGITQFLLQFFIGIDPLFQLWSKIIIPFLGKSFAEAVITNNSWLVNLGGSTVFRATSLLPDPHMLAFYLNMTAPLALGFFLKNKKQVYFYAFSIISLGSFLTFSRGGYLGFIGAIVFFTLFLFYRNITKEHLKKLAITVFLALIILTTPNPISNRLTSSFNLSEGSNSQRIETWKQSLEVIGNHTFLGVGLGNYALEIKPSASWREPIYSHNLFLDIAAEIGILGVLAWILLLYYSIKSSSATYLKNNRILGLAVASSIIAFVVHSIFETALFSVHILPLLLILISTNLNEDN